MSSDGDEATTSEQPERASGCPYSITRIAIETTIGTPNMIRMDLAASVLHVSQPGRFWPKFSITTTANIPTNKEFGTRARRVLSSRLSAISSSRPELT